LKTQNYTFAEVVTGGTYHSTNGTNYIKDVYGLKLTDYEGKPESHISLFRFSSDLLDYYKQKKTISGYDGLIHTGKYLISDFDSITDIETARQDLIAFCKYLETFLSDANGLDAIPIYFSGSKGFNLYLPACLIGEIVPSKNLHTRVKCFFETICNNIIQEGGKIIETLDFQIYTKNHLIRLPNTINSKSGLHKIPLLYSELQTLSIDEIKEMAREPRRLEYPKAEFKENPELRKIFFQDITEPKQETRTVNGGGSLFLKSVPAGERNTALLKNANRLRYKNIPLEDAKEILTLWNNSLSEPLPADEFNRTIESSYKYETKEKINSVDRNSFSNFDDRKKIYYDLLKDIKAKTVKTGFNLIDEKSRGVRPGEIALLVAVTSVGKSAITQNFLMNYCKENPDKTALYFSLEMGEAEVYEREVQISENISGYEVEKIFSKDIKGLNNFVTITEPLTAELIPAYLDKASEYFSDVGLFAVDHSGLLDGRGGDEYQKISNAMRLIKQIAMKYKIPCVVISQINRQTALNKDERISLFSAKSSGELENSSSIVMALEKITDRNYKLFGYDTAVLNPDVIHQYNEKSISFLCLSLLKNRRGGTAQSLLEMSRRSLRITESKLNPDLVTQKKLIDELVF
jgi:DNA-binding transcriptional MerR regulator